MAVDGWMASRGSTGVPLGAEDALSLVAAPLDEEVPVGCSELLECISFHIQWTHSNNDDPPIWSLESL